MPAIEVWTASDLNAVRDNLSGDYIQMADIDLSGYANWVPIGKEEFSVSSFSGVYNGNGFVISNLAIDNDVEWGYVGLFASIDSCTLNNIRITDADINSSTDVSGALAGRAINSSILNCSSAGTVAGREVVGGLVGLMIEGEGEGEGEPNPSIIRGSFSSCTVTGEMVVGGLVGNIVIYHGAP